MNAIRRTIVPVLAAVLLGTSALSAQVKYPPRAETLDIQIHYRIQAGRQERIEQFRALETHLTRLGFVASSREDADLDILDPNAELFTGTIAPGRVLDVLNDPRVIAILFAPTGHAFPDDRTKPVAIRVGLEPSTLPPRDRKPRHQQVVAQLEKLGFREAIGYDSRGYALVRGSIPLQNLNRLLKDLRGEPGGWFLAETPPEALPSPLRDAWPIRWVEVLPGEEIPKLQLPMLPDPIAKYSSALRAALAAGGNGPMRVEMVLDRPASELVATIRNRLLSEYGTASVEGLSGFIITVTFDKPVDVERFAVDPAVNAVRLPRAGSETVGPPVGGEGDSTSDVLAETRLNRLHDLGAKGQGVRLIVVGSDFTGANALIGKALPNGTRLIDLTAELSPTVQPLPADANPGHGTAVASAAAAAAPRAELVLVRVHREAFFQLQTVARFARGDLSFSEAMQSRIEQMSARSRELERQKAIVIEEYRKAFSDLSDDEGPRQRREQAEKALQAVNAKEREVATTIRRYSELQDSLKTLAGGNIVVVNALVWEMGYPLDGLSELSQSLDEFFAGEAMRSPPTRSATRPYTQNMPLWVQAASSAAGSVWGGPFRDEENNGVLEFASPLSPLPAGEWSREMNFLGTRNADGTVTRPLTAGTTLRLTIQWREPHSSEFYAPPNPVFPLTLRLLRQLDPAGETRASDELEEVARSLGTPVRLLAQPNFAVYEQSLEVAIPTDGRYALRVEGQSAYDPRLPALRQEIEIHPRIYAEFTPTREDGARPVFTTFAPAWSGVGIPGDAASALTIADAAKPGEEAPRLLGAGPSTLLRPKPDLYLSGSLAGEGGGQGPGIAAGSAAGLSASLIVSGAPSSEIMRALKAKPGDRAEIPLDWLKWVRPMR